jgi:hypothetical protein
MKESGRLENGGSKLDGNETYLVVTTFFARLVTVIPDIKFIWHCVVCLSLSLSLRRFW